MSEKTRFFSEQSTRRPPADAVEIAHDLVAVLTEDDPVRNAVWTDRLAAYDAGEIEAFDVDDEVMGQLGVQYGRA